MWIKAIKAPQFHSVDPTQSQKLEIEPCPINSSKKPSSNVSPEGATRSPVAVGGNPAFASATAAADAVDAPSNNPVDLFANSGATRRIAS